MNGVRLEARARRGALIAVVCLAIFVGYGAMVAAVGLSVSFVPEMEPLTRGQAPNGAQPPCASVPESRQFDFWVGEWDVTTRDGHPVGTNRIERIAGDCALLENWRGARGDTGKSMSFFNPSTHTWRQVWVSDGGGVSEFVGEYRNGAVRFEGETFYPDGRTVKRRLTFSPLAAEGVRQVSELSTDGGKSWSVNYDFIYKRRVANPRE